MDFLSTIIRIKVKLISYFIQKCSSDHSYPSDAYLNYLKARRYEFKALHNIYPHNKVKPFHNPNERNAIWYFLHSASEGYSSAQFKLGQCYLTGQLGLQTNHQKAQEWLSLAADQGHIEAQDTLHRLHHCK